MRLRLVDSPAGESGSLNMGIDEALLGSVSRGESPPTLRLYRWTPPCVTIGYFQSLETEVDLEACRARGVDAVRRLTGGGAVFHDEEITYSLVIPLSHELALGGASGGASGAVLASYRAICAGLVRGLAELGLDASFEPINDICVGGKKVSGNAQTRRQGCLLQHGTVLLGLDAELMFTLLKVPAEKLKGRAAQARSRVASLRDLLGREVPYEEAAAALERGFELAWSAELIRGSFSSSELAEARRLAAERFSTREWNFRR